MNFNTVLTDYRTYLLAQQKSKHTVNNFLADVIRCLTQLSSKSLDLITASDIDHFLVSFSTKVDGTAKNANTMNRTKTAIRSFFGWACNSHLIAVSPAEHLRLKRVDRLPPVYLTDTEEHQLLLTVQNHATDIHAQRDYAILQLLLNTGIRVAELTQIDLVDIDGKHLIIRKQKGGNPIRKFLPSVARQVITEYITGERSKYESQSQSKALFLNQQGERMNPRAIQFLTQKWVKLAGIDKPITPHKLRHTFATSLYSKSHDILVVQKALGHRNITHTQIYAHISDQSLETAMENRVSVFQP
ncbi:MAG: tyrosine-type recombinase/integrase [bacterium]|nr:tyrosine-type recombinase/integrase [bacterium]